MLSAAPLLALALVAADAPLSTSTRDGVTLASDVSAMQRASIHDVSAAALHDANARLVELGLERKSEQALRLRVFAHESDYEDWRRRTRDQNTKISPLSYYDETNREVVATWQAGSAPARAQLRRQVARHALLQFAKNPSNWFEEGFAGYFQGFRTDPYGDPIDRVDPEMLRQIRAALGRESFCPLFELLDLQDVEFYGLAGAQQSPWPRAVLYAQSWSLVFWMLESEDDAASRLLAFEVERLETGRWDQADARAIVRDAEPEWRAFLAREDLSDFGDLLDDAWEALARGESEDARWLATKALDFDETSRSAQRVLGKAALAHGDADVAAHAFFELLRVRPSDFDAALGLARADCARLAQEPQDPDRLAAVLESCVRASKLAPLGQGHVGYAMAAEAAESIGAHADALELVRLALKERGTSAQIVSELRERERRLIKKAIGKG